MGVNEVAEMLQVWAPEAAIIETAPVDETENKKNNQKRGRRSKEEILREKAEKDKAEWERLPFCEEKSCHAWQDGRCIALSDNYFGGRSCPFYKKLDVCQRERKECLTKLIRAGRMDLVEKYKSVLADLGVFGLTDGYTERAAADLERYSEECLRELIAEAGTQSEPSALDENGALDEPWIQDEGDDWDD